MIAILISSKETSHLEMICMAKPLAKVKEGDLLTAEKMNEIIDRINDLEKRLRQMEEKAPKGKFPK
jgi:hypothetical protein